MGIESASLAVPSRGPRPGPGTGGLGAVPVALVAVVVAGIMLSVELDARVQPIFLFGLLVMSLLVPYLYWVLRQADLAIFLLVPTVMSAFQNVYLLPVAADISVDQMQIVITLNVAFAVAMLFVSGAFGGTDVQQRHRLRDRVLWTLLILTVSAMGSTLVFGGSVVPAIAAFRNLATPFVFFLTGMFAARTTSAHRYLSMLMIVGLATVSFGFLELYTPDFWQENNLAELWEAKGLPINPVTGLPPNFYSSEIVDGALARRMASSFADPVNFGTFIFICFMGAWMLRRPVAMGVFAVATVLAISKGAFLGVLVFAVLWSRWYLPRPLHYLTIGVAGSAGVGFILFSVEGSTGSTILHLNGLLSAFQELPQHPLGRGVGNVGVLAATMGSDSGSAITESGLGAVVGQLGIVGLGCYVAFFWLVIRAASRLIDLRTRTFALSVAAGFMLNMMFNEVALSPNSAAPYFVSLGLILGRDMGSRRREPAHRLDRHLYRS